MTSISAIGKKFGLARSTLLYYDRLRLVRPTYRTAAGYRLYSAEDAERLRQICRYRETGLPLAAIKRLLDEETPSTSLVADALHQRLTELNHEIAALRRQQQVVLKLLPRRGQDRLARAMTKDKWVALLRSSGLSDAEMRQWHVAFERQSPLAHQDFLESLGLAEKEIQRIRQASAAAVRQRRVRDAGGKKTSAGQQTRS